MALCISVQQSRKEEISPEGAIKVTGLQELGSGHADQRLKLGGRNICVFELGIRYVGF